MRGLENQEALLLGSDHGGRLVRVDVSWRRIPSGADTRYAIERPRLERDDNQESLPDVGADTAFLFTAQFEHVHGSQPGDEGSKAEKEGGNADTDGKAADPSLTAALSSFACHLCASRPTERGVWHDTATSLVTCPIIAAVGEKGTYGGAADNVEPFTPHLRKQKSSPIVPGLRDPITSALQRRRIAEETMSFNSDRTMTSSLSAAAW